MKKIIMTAGMAIFAVMAGYSQEVVPQWQGDEAVLEIPNGQTEKMYQKELPTYVLEALDAEPYQNWDIGEVYMVKPETFEKTGVAYEVELNKGRQEMKVQFDAGGVVVGQQKEKKKWGIFKKK